jgi:nicotinate-nucleotide adenylyltransferase
MVRLENKLKLQKIKIGILGGTFDPAHKGHLEISKQAKKKFRLKNIIWAITKQNPFKDKSKSNLKNRMKFSKKIISKKKYIKIKFYEEKIDSNRTIDLIEYLSKENKNEIYFIMGADNLINFHKWYKWKSIIRKCNILVFDRQGYKAKSLKSVTFNGTNNKNLTFVNFNKVYLINGKKYKPKKYHIKHFRLQQSFRHNLYRS